MADHDRMGHGLQLVGALFSNFLLGKLSLEFKLRRMSVFHEIQMAIFPNDADPNNPLWPSRLFKPTQSSHCGHSLMLNKKRVRLNVAKFSFSNRVVND